MSRRVLKRSRIGKNHSMKIIYRVFKVKRAAFFNLPCAGE